MGEFWRWLTAYFLGGLSLLAAMHIWVSTDTYKAEVISDGVDNCHSLGGYVDYVDSKDGWTYFCNNVPYRINNE